MTARQLLPLAALLAACSTYPAPRQETTPWQEVESAEDGRSSTSKLEAALRAPNAPLRARAARAFGRIQEAAGAEPLAAALAVEQDRAVRLELLFALGQLGLREGTTPPELAVTAVRGGLADPDPELRAAAAEALGKLAPESAAQELTSLLADAAAPVREAAAYALFRLRFAPVWRKEVEKAPELPAASITALARAMADPEAAVRRAAVYPFSRYAAPGLTAELGRVLGDGDPWARLFAARALGRAGGDAAKAALLSAVRDPDPQVRAEVVTALAQLKAGGALPPGLDVDASFHVRAALARALATPPTEAARETLRKLAQDEAPTVRAAALAALAENLKAGAGDDLERALTGASWTDRAAAARALGQLGEGGLPLVRRAFSDPDRRVQTAAIEALGGFQGADADALVVEALAASDLAVRGTAVGLVAARASLDHRAVLAAAYAGASGPDWIEVREGIVDALAELPETAAELTTIASTDAAPSVRTKARIALAKLGQPLPEAAEAKAAEVSPWLHARFAKHPRVVLETSKGKIEIECFGDDAPLHVASFLSLVRKGFYNGLIWHRLAPNFVIQGGDPRGDGWGGPGYNLRDEINPRRYEAGTVGMPKAGKDTGGGQLFITHLPTPHLDGNYTVFGQVVRGMEVVNEIEIGDVILAARVVE